MAKINIKEAAEEYSVPPSRIRQAINSGLLPAVLRKRKWVFDEEDLIKILGESTSIERAGNSFFLIKKKDLLIKEKQTESFQTTAAADEYLALAESHYGEVMVI